MLMMSPHIAVGAALVLRFLEPTAELCEVQITCLSLANFVGWLMVVNYLMLERRVGPFFIMVSEMIARDFVRFMVIPLTILPAFAIMFNTSVAFPSCLSTEVLAIHKRDRSDYQSIAGQDFQIQPLDLWKPLICNPNHASAKCSRQFWSVCVHIGLDGSRTG